MIKFILGLFIMTKSQRVHKKNGLNFDIENSTKVLNYEMKFRNALSTLDLV